MMPDVLHFYRRVKPDFEYCFNIQTSSPLTAQELATLRWLLAETFDPDNLQEQPHLAPQDNVVEVGPRINIETAFSTNAVAICHGCGLTKVTRLELSRRYLPPAGADRQQFTAEAHDRMTEYPYEKPLETFTTGAVPEETFSIPITSGGPDELRKFNRESGLGMDDWDINYYYELFTKTLGRDPTNVELFMLGNNNSEHSRHWFFKGKLVIDGKEAPETLLELVKSTFDQNPSNSVIAFSDNSSAIRGYDIWTIIPRTPGKPGPLEAEKTQYHILFSAETHNYPSGIQPFQGATTGTGGRIRDVHATGRGSLVIAGTAGYCTAALNIPGYPIPGEPEGLTYPPELASPLDILVEASNGASDYGNKFGEPLIQGFVRTFDQILPEGERRAWIKPIMFTGGIGQLDSRHIRKETPEKGMLIVQVGGPAYRIGAGGGSASSMIQGENIAELDFNAVQRGNAEMENKLNRVIRTCVEMGDNNPLLSAHDQGAGGPGNVLAEITDPAGGKLQIRRFSLGDPSMAVVDIWCAEYQERSAFLIHQDRQAEFTAVCEREKVNCEILGEITGDGRIIVHDEKTDSNPVDLPLDNILGHMPQKEYKIDRARRSLEPLRLPDDLTVAEAVRLVFRLPSVGSKGYLVRKVDRAVTGLIAQQQCCGPLQLPVADVAVVAQSHFGLTGGATAIGEQPIKMLIDEKAGARMAVAEMLTNLVSARISALTDIKCSVNWMWAAKLPGEGARIYDAARAMSDLMKELGIAVDGGKDSISMAARVKDENVKAPGEMVVSGYATMPDISLKVTPDIKQPGKSRLLLLDLSGGRNRLGGSALAQAFGQLGNESPDVADAGTLASAFKAVQQLISDGLVLACHDRSDGGLVTTLAEMAMSGDCGISVDIPGDAEPFATLFSEELGLVLEYRPQDEAAIKKILDENDIPSTILGDTLSDKNCKISRNGQTILSIATDELLRWWEATSDRLEEEQMNVETAREQAASHGSGRTNYHLTFSVEPPAAELLSQTDKPKVAIIREEGSNGDREMSSAFYWSGFEPWDITMTDLLAERINLDQFRGIVFVGGFAYADVLDPAKGWASAILFNPRLKAMFDRFFDRPDTFSLGVCNGCQLMAYLGLLPWRGIETKAQPSFVQNRSERFESHWGMLRISESPAIMLKGMAGSVLGIWSDHGGGRLYCPDPDILQQARERNLTPVAYVDSHGRPTEQYRFNPNGSPQGIAGFCSSDGRHLAMMPHPERSFLLYQWPFVPDELKTACPQSDVDEYRLQPSPWLKMFQNAREWCDGTR